MCKKKCVNCDTNVDTTDFNDICYPGNYDGINNFGNCFIVLILFKINHLELIINYKK